MSIFDIKMLGGDGGCVELRMCCNLLNMGYPYQIGLWFPKTDK